MLITNLSQYYEDKPDADEFKLLFDYLDKFTKSDLLQKDTLILLGSLVTKEDWANLPKLVEAMSAIKNPELLILKKAVEICDNAQTH